MAVAVDAYGFERHELRVHAGLVEPFCEAGIVFAVIAALSREINHGNFLEIDQLVRGLGLHVTGHHVAGRVGLGLQHRLQLGGVLDRRIVSNRLAGNSPG